MLKSARKSVKDTIINGTNQASQKTKRGEWEYTHIYIYTHTQLWKKIRDHFKKNLNQHLYMYGSHSIPVSVEFQHRHTSFYLVRY